MLELHVYNIGKVKTLTILFAVISGTQPFFLHRYSKRKTVPDSINGIEIGCNFIPGKAGLLIGIAWN